MLQLGALLALCVAVFAEVVVKSGGVTIYDRSPKLRIRGSGFSADEASIHLTFSPQLRQDKDYTLLKQDDETLVLRLFAGRKWSTLDGSSSMLRLTEVDMGKGNELTSPVTVATIVPTPTVFESQEVIYQSASLFLAINGTGFEGVKESDVKLYFDPPRFLEIDYEIADVRPNTILLGLRHGAKWAEVPGPLRLKGIDTGGGAITVTSDERGLIIAEVQADLDAHGVVVEDRKDLLIYNDEPQVVIEGDGFNAKASSNRLAFANGLKADTNYTVTGGDDTSLTLQLNSATSLWRRNGASLPGPLVLLAVDAGAGFVAVGPTNAKKGRVVAMVYERPTVTASTARLYKSQSHELHIKGTGFPIGRDVELEFDPPMSHFFYNVRVISREEIEVTLEDNKMWAPQAGALKLVAMASFGSVKAGNKGRVEMPNGGVVVATIVEDDTAATLENGVSITPTQQRVYESMLHETVSIRGAGFKSGMSLELDPPLKENTDYKLTVVSAAEVSLELMSGKKWHTTGSGLLRVTAVTVGGKRSVLAGDAGGIRVATVLADPVVQASDSTMLHQTQSKALVIRGSGFTDTSSVQVKLSPTPAGTYEVSSVYDDSVRVLLREGKEWLPDYMGIKEGERVPIRVTAIDTGAGMITLSEGVVVGYVIPDRDGVSCDDSCEFALDGVCDDSSAVADRDWGTFSDDDYGGYYTDEMEEGYYDDYYMDDQFTLSACLPGTDCTDCGGIDASPAQGKNDPSAPAVTCTNTCAYGRDGVCDDPRGGNYCALGTDCQDCGPVGASNFTVFEDDAWWDDDDEEWGFSDGDFLDQAKGYEHNKHRLSRPDAEIAGPAAVFISVLEGVVYTVGMVIFMAGSWLFWRWYNGHSVPFLSAFSPESAPVSSRELEMGGFRRMPITPDVLRT